MVDMPATPYQRQPVCLTAFPHHSLSTQTYETIVLEGFRTQGCEGVANIADAQYYEPEESQQASQVLEDCELDAWSRNSNAVPDVREEINQSKLLRRPSVPMICRLGSLECRESVVMSTAQPTHSLQNPRRHDPQMFQQAIEGYYQHSLSQGIEDLGLCPSIRAI
jgi:hypothetical protein